MLLIYKNLKFYPLNWTNKAFKADHEIAPMAKKCIKFVLKILKRVISTYYFYHFVVLIFKSNLTFKTRLILGSRSNNFNRTRF